MLLGLMLAASSVAAVPAVAAPPAAQPMRIYVVDSGAGTNRRGALFELSVTGQRTLLTDFGSTSRTPGVKHEPLGQRPASVAVERDGTILVLDVEAGGRGELFQVDSSTGSREVLSDFSDKKQGPRGRIPSGLALLPDGTILVSDGGVGTKCSNDPKLKALPCGVIFSIDPVMGERAVLSDFGDPGQGPVTERLSAVAAGMDGTIYAASSDSAPGGAGVKAVYLIRVDRATGARTIVSTKFRVGGVLALAVEPGGFVLADECCHQLDRVDPLTGALTKVNDLWTGTPDDAHVAPTLGNAIALVSGSATPTLPDGTMLVSGDPARVIAIDPATPQQRRLFSDLHDPTQGPTGVSPAGIVVVPGTVAPPPPPLPPAPGSIIAVEPGPQNTGRLFVVDPVSGIRRVLTDFADPASNTLGLTGSPWGVAVGPDGTIYVTDFRNDRVWTVDPITGERRVLVNFPGLRPFGIAFHVSGDLLVTDRGPGGGVCAGSVYRLILPSGTTRNAFGVACDPTGVTSDASGTILVVDDDGGTNCHGFGGCGALYTVDPVTGAFSTLINFGAGAPLGEDPTDLAIDRDGTLLVADSAYVDPDPSIAGALFRIDPTTRTRSLVTTTQFLSEVRVGADGTILVTCMESNFIPSICRVDPATGALTMISNFGDVSTGAVSTVGTYRMTIYP